MIISGRRVFIDGAFVPAQLKTEHGRITAVEARGKDEADVDYRDARIVPGFVDVHCHGAFSCDAGHGKEEEIRTWAKKIVPEGVTTFLATTLTAKEDVLTAALRAVAAAKKKHRPGADGADIAGIHLEGPFLNAAYKGAQPEDAIVAPDIGMFERLFMASEGLIRIVTLAPECDEGLSLTRYLAEKGIVVSVGHSAATCAQVEQAVQAGAKSITHTFNAQSPFHHREAGVAGAALAMGDLYSEIICDLRHVSKEALRIFFKCKDRDRTVMVTDALLCKGSAPGEVFEFGPHRIAVDADGCARIEGTDTLAGSTLRMDEGLRNLTKTAKIPFADALMSATANPAALIGMGDRIGAIRNGYDADLCILGEDDSVQDVWCKGIRQENVV
ncbi:MAG: N-acetylglucosamine-6-phosphate deacetylase [Lachnospiraceae bacterium]|nr:N-acetylglucosamine-6-phosphate deacetylase [Lachnospiraceae bacterium]